jgi:zinc D-Ala-D-Ala dipeptidase
MKKTNTLKRCLLAVLLVGFHIAINAQESFNKYGIKVISDYNEYMKSVLADSANELLNIAKHVPGVVLDIKYATKDNFLKVPAYSGPYAFARKPVVEALVSVQAELKRMGYGLKVYDAYRPYQVTVYFYEKIRDTVFVAAPWKGSKHNRGCAVDVSLVSLKTGTELKMPTKFDDFTSKAHISYMKLPKAKIQNRELLISVMERHGFKVYEAEWWHFDFKGWNTYDLMDIAFEKLLGKD